MDSQDSEPLKMLNDALKLTKNKWYVDSTRCRSAYRQNVTLLLFGVTTYLEVWCKSW